MWRFRRLSLEKSAEERWLVCGRGYVSQRRWVVGEGEKSGWEGLGYKSKKGKSGQLEWALWEGVMVGLGVVWCGQCVLRGFLILTLLSLCPYGPYWSSDMSSYQLTSTSTVHAIQSPQGNLRWGGRCWIGGHICMARGGFLVFIGIVRVTWPCSYLFFFLFLSFIASSCLSWKIFSLDFRARLWSCNLCVKSC